MGMTEYDAGRSGNPVDTVEQLAAFNDWIFERNGEDEITIAVTDASCGYEVSFSWMEDVEVFHLACAIDLDIPRRHIDETIRLLALVNAQLWVGHFDLWRENGTLLFRDGVMFAGGAAPNAAQCQAMFDAAIGTCDRYIGAFHYVAHGFGTAPEAMQVAMFETVGEA